MEKDEKALPPEGEENKDGQEKEEGDDENLALSEELKKAQDEAAKWRRIAEKNAKKEEPPKDPIIQPTGLSKEEAELIVLGSQGYKPEQLEELKALAKVRGKSLMETKNDPIFVRMEEQWAAEAKAEKAKLGASKGSGQVKREKDFKSSGLSDEEHKELWKKQRDQ